MSGWCLVPHPPCSPETGCSCGEHFLHMLSASSFKDLLNASLFLPMTGELPSTEITQKWQDIYNVRGGGRWWVTSTQKESKLVDKCPSLLSSKGKNLRRILRGSRGSPVRLNLSHHDSNQARSTLPQPLLLSGLY